MSQDTEYQLHDSIADEAVSLDGPPDAIGIDRKMPLISAVICTLGLLKDRQHGMEFQLPCARCAAKTGDYRR